MTKYQSFLQKCSFKIYSWKTNIDVWLEIHTVVLRGPSTCSLWEFDHSFISMEIKNIDRFLKSMSKRLESAFNLTSVLYVSNLPCAIEIIGVKWNRGIQGDSNSNSSRGSFHKDYTLWNKPADHMDPLPASMWHWPDGYRKRSQSTSIHSERLSCTHALL